MAAWLSWASDLASPCLPFCNRNEKIHQPKLNRLVSAQGRTNLPLGELQVHLATTFSDGTGFFLERAADRAGSDGHVAVVAIRREHQSWIDQTPSGIVGGGKGIRQTSGFPEGHLDGELENAEVRLGDTGVQTTSGL